MIKPIILQSDFGLSDGAVSAMEGVIVSVNPDARIYHLTHDIPAYDIYLASYRLYQAHAYWPKGSIFASIVDPGVGYGQVSLAAELNSGQVVLTPDNGTISHLAELEGLKRIYAIDKGKNLLNKDNHSYTFFGRDLYAYSAIRLASGLLDLSDIGPQLSLKDIVLFPIGQVKTQPEEISGVIDIIDVRYGSLWTNIPYDLFEQQFPGVERVHIRITFGHQTYFDQIVQIGHSFADVGIGEALVYRNSLQRMGIALNQQSLADQYNISYGIDWHVQIRPDSA